jgi:aspartate racemase
MRTIGLIGGLSPQSTAHYYEWINDGVRERLGGLNGASMIIASVNQQEITDLREEGNWPQVADILSEKALTLENAGADFVMIACNSVHHVAEKIEHALAIPFLHIADPTAEAMKKQGITCAGLLGTKYTMKMEFYRNRLKRYGIETVIPDDENCSRINSIIFDELCKGVVKKESKQEYMDIAQSLFNNGAQGLILGCTEIDMIIDQRDFEQPVFDTTRLHIEKALAYALGDTDILATAA